MKTTMNQSIISYMYISYYAISFLLAMWYIVWPRGTGGCGCHLTITPQPPPWETLYQPLLMNAKLKFKASTIVANERHAPMRVYLGNQIDNSRSWRINHGHHGGNTGLLHEIIMFSNDQAIIGRGQSWTSYKSKFTPSKKINMASFWKRASSPRAVLWSLGLCMISFLSMAIWKVVCKVDKGCITLIHYTDTFIHASIHSSIAACRMGWN